jgi:hypothetical protein
VSGRRAGLTALLRSVLLGAMSAAACGGGAENHLPQMLRVDAHWNDSPGTVDQIGYQLWVDLLWPDRREACYPLSPNLVIHVDDDIVVTPPIEGDCGYESFMIVNGVQPRASTTVSLLDGDRVLGQGTFDGLFPDSGATLVAPAAGQPVEAGGSFAIALPRRAQLDVGAQFYWTDVAANVPPFYSWASGALSADGLTFEGTAPGTAGHAMVAVDGIFGEGAFVSPTSCSGFQYCDGFPTADRAGPVSIEVDP